MKTYSIVGVTGHIDHGKTSLVRQLTGVDTDTQPEEKRRGITIDLGFAAFTEGEHRFALIDAPGHQKYIGNLLAGVSALDIGLLVVAADQGIQEQTLEHAAVLQGLGVRRLIVAISRIDLVPDAVVQELSEELQLFLAEVGFDDLPIIPISSVTGAGIDQLKSELHASAAANIQRAAAVSANREPFRLPIDRIFSVEGRGLVVAGTVWSGEVRVGDTLELAGTRDTYRVRELEVHGEVVASSRSGYRTAINLVGSSHQQLHRGDELVTPDSHPSASLLLVTLRMFSDASELRCPATVQLHTATTSCAARIIGARELSRNDTAVVLVQPAHRIVASHGQACLFRRPYPIGSFASGRVLTAFERRSGKTKDLLELGRRLHGHAAAQRLLAWVDFWGETQPNAGLLALQLGIPAEELEQILPELVADKALLQLGPQLVSLARADQTKKLLLKIMHERAQAGGDAWLVENAVMERARSIGTPALIKWGLQQLIDEQRLVRVHDLVALASDQTTLSKKQRQAMEQILALYALNRSPPTLKEISERLQLSMDVVRSLTRFATQQRILIDLGQGFLISSQVFQLMCQELAELFAEEAEQTVAAIRDRWQVTRKHAIPLLEYCDRQAITARHDVARRAGKRLPELCNQPASLEPAVE